MLEKLFYTCMCFLCNSRFKSSLELMLCVIDISSLNKTYLNLFGILVLLLVIIGAIFNYLDFVDWGIAKKSLMKPKG